VSGEHTGARPPSLDDAAGETVMAKLNAYHFEKQGTVSIWVSTVPWEDLPDSYFEQHYGREDPNDPFTQFSEDFGFGFFDVDEVETNGSPGAPKPMDELLGECSFSSSYVLEAKAQAAVLGLTTTSFVFLLYEMEYQPEKTGVSRSAYMQFLGAFPFDPEMPKAR
jgi:hypothetical protein